MCRGARLGEGQWWQGGRAWWGGTTPRRQINTAAYLPHTTPPTLPDFPFYSGQTSECTATFVVQIIARFLRPAAARRKSRANISAPRGSCRCRLQALLLLYFITTNTIAPLALLCSDNHNNIIERKYKIF